MTKIQFDGYTKARVERLRERYLLGAEAELTEEAKVYSVDARFRGSNEEFEDTLNAIEEYITEVLEERYEEKLARQKRKVEKLTKNAATFEEMVTRLQEQLAELRKGE